MALQPPPNPTREQLPESLFPCALRPVAEVNPDCAIDLAVQLPQLKRISSFEKRVQAAGKFMVSVKMTDPTRKPTEIPPGMTPPAPATAHCVTRPDKTFRGNLARLVMSKEEFDLYTQTWVEWLTAHAEYDTPEDHDDLNTICMETALQHRIMKAAFAKGLDPTVSLNASYKRKQTARENLAARRSDKLGLKSNSGGKNIINIAVLAGNIPPEEAARRKQVVAKDRETEDMFLERTISLPHVTVDTSTTDEE